MTYFFWQNTRIHVIWIGYTLSVFVFSIGLFKTEKESEVFGVTEKSINEKKNSYLALKFSATKLANQNRAK